MKKLTMQIRINPTYLPERSSQTIQRFLWSYEMTISNENDEIVQLLNRYWRITDMTGHIEEVQGPGVIGLQPIIKPGKKFVYSSYCQLNLPQGTMEGHYEFQTLNDENFTVPIPKFVLAAPEEVITAFRGRFH